ncbi:MAG: bifunctional phosphoribosyl-AMP cyclohydrolase/phosphoribosyl-ATP diphosphatase HisIE [Oscillospiraceae bacterium]|nr:bifunctional phosphoribosyl-AMP cyclohydrolase/phosphoribosyl-ATP diphosphatase HisIE [Oscillospiraceae bacterium]
MLNISELKFDSDGLIPAVVVDCQSGTVLMLAYMNYESLSISINEGRTCFWSRSRQELWRKGDSSGNVQHIVSIRADCDRDALVISVDKDGPACHTGSESCFFEPVYGTDAGVFSLDSLYEVISDRKTNRAAGSYTTYLFEKGIDKILKKVGEESTEVIIAGKGGARSEAIYEISDLIYHVLVLMAQMDISPDDVRRELAARHLAGGGESGA